EGQPIVGESPLPTSGGYCHGLLGQIDAHHLPLRAPDTNGAKHVPGARNRERRRLQSLRLGTLELTSAAILAGSALTTEYDCDHSSEPPATATILTVRFCPGSSTAP